MEFHLRPPTEYDLQVIRHINDLVQAQPWSLNQIIDEFEQNHPLSSVAIDSAGRVVGFIFCRQVSDDTEIMLVGVTPSCMRIGVGRALVKNVISGTKSKRILLEVSEQNLPAIRLYESLGFKTFSHRLQYYRDGSNALLMKLDLAKP